ncbi:MAG TPA: hypothetical protein VMT66_11145 [Steroidobacteraceae bacterium]|nr:hypothetical protein [Steroidobacteraceae bacterium]
MSLLLQQLLVGVLVIGCALFSAWRLASVRLRLRALEWLRTWPGVRRAPWLLRLQERTRARELRACGGCAGGAAGAAGAGESSQDAPARNRTPGALRR